MAIFTQFGRIGDIPEKVWQGLRRDAYPFLDYRFLKALEDQRCIGGDSGWQVAILAGWFQHPHPDGTDEADLQPYLDRVDVLVPLFHKYDSYGEYVFDWSWADAYHRHGIDYYPKLLWAVPFTPTTGPRLLYRGNAADAWAMAISAVQQLCDHQQLSGWHLNFPQATDLPHLRDQPDLLLRSACQYHWYNRHYRDFEHYLEHFTSRKRKNVRKERQKVTDAGLTLQRLTGTAILDHIDFFYRCYQSTYLKRGRKGYLNRGFFRQLAAQMNDQMLLVIASHQNRDNSDGNHNDNQAEPARPVAAALYFYDDQHLYGRYWGCTEEHDGLHFEACYYQGIEFCIERQLAHFDPGTQGEHKIARGFEPVLTHSLHRLQHPGFHDAVGRFIDEETREVLTWQQEAATLLPFNENALQQPRMGAEPLPNIHPNTDPTDTP